ncbi:MAG: lysine--tRNA ligase, partial [Acidobacteria bacterium]|nr:lysine--tRNA ligase [Acidobacteriota bacterium]
MNDPAAPSPDDDPAHSAVDPDAVRGGGFDQPYSYPVDTSVAEVVERFSGLEPGVETGHVVSVAGRLMLRRTQGKLAFGSLHDASGQVQLFAAAAGTPAFPEFCSLNLGDWIGVCGEVMTTRRGELSIRVDEWTLLAPT